jgi:cytochrome b6-f complex iron-sulfur subunit
MTEPVEVARPDAQPETRRRFLDRVWRVLGLVAAGEFAAVVAAYLWPRRAGEDSSRGVVEAGPVGDFTPASITPFPGGKFYLVRLADGGFLALASRCTHLGCTVTVDLEQKTFPCPCHASAFDLRGDVLEPPASRALDLYPVAIDGGVVRVDTRRRIQRSRFEPGQVTSL